jgi:DNA-binding response OmpR family regulator
VFIIANETEQARKLRTELVERGFECLTIPHNDDAVEQIARQSHGVSLLDMEDATTSSERRELARKMRQDMNIPLLALMSRERLNDLDSDRSVDDFAVAPWEASEIIARIKRILRQEESIESDEVIKCGDLVIDSTKCEVSLCGKPIMLTFKEYQLLKFLATNKGKVFTRDVLLNKVWGWDYYGGDRTVDVHIRRLRGKVEDSTHAFIETVRNIGYKLREDL